MPSKKLETMDELLNGQDFKSQCTMFSLKLNLFFNIWQQTINKDYKPIDEKITSNFLRKKLFQLHDPIIVVYKIMYILNDAHNNPILPINFIIGSIGFKFFPSFNLILLICSFLIIFI